MARKPYPTDVNDEEWAFVAPYLALLPEDAPQRGHDLREVFNALRPMVRAGAAWRMLPGDLPPWEAVYQQTQRRIRAGVFEDVVADLRLPMRLGAGRGEDPTAAAFDSRTLQSTPESGGRGGYDGAKRRKGSKAHMAVDTLGHLLALHVAPADVQDRAEVGRPAGAAQEAANGSLEKGFVDQGYTGEAAAAAAEGHGVELEVVRHPAARKGFVLLPRRWVVERSFAWLARFRRLARDHERLARTLEGMHYLAFACILLGRLGSLVIGP